MSQIKRNFYKNNIKTMFLIDILYMKDINAVYGFENGNNIIKQMFKLLQNNISKEIKKNLDKKVFIDLQNIYVDVFSLTIYDDLKEKEITQIKKIIFDKVISNKFFLLNNTSQIYIDVTIGCSKSDDNKLQIYAEKALHSAKLNYLNFAYFDAKLFKNELSSINLVQVLNYNIDNNLIEPYLQPIVDVNTLKVHKYEALMRLFDEEGNVLSPSLFLQKSKKYRLYTKFMLLLIEKVIDYILKYKKHISINLEFNDILNPQIKEYIINELESHDIGQYLSIEILESEKISNFDTVNNFINDLKKYNVKIAIDDFGTGFSNYEYILNLNVDYIKIDGTLIKRINEEIYSNLISSIVQFCKKHDIKVIAEYVSDLKILRYVRSLGIDYAQGYYVGIPKSIEKTIEACHNEE